MNRDSKENQGRDVLMTTNKKPFTENIDDAVNSDEESSNSASAVELKTPISV
jgi:hypothetical protein